MPLFSRWGPAGVSSQKKFVFIHIYLKKSNISAAARSRSTHKQPRIFKIYIYKFALGRGRAAGRCAAGQYLHERTASPLL
jgi:hypothetical protein